MRHRAIAAGCQLPMTAFDKRQIASQAAKANSTQLSMDCFTQKQSRFSNPILNQLIGYWVIRTSQPWLRMEDEALRACFQYANPQAQVYGRTWVAGFAHKAYLGLRRTVISELQVSQSSSPFLFFSDSFDHRSLIRSLD